ncbi:hypothetical protein [Curtobacterium sp. L1-20]|uniref:hypothetical protein n=1 Tax=Curtobacterium sp. L1-20 TaxID=3138181 RepID=UPI003B51D56C
MHHHLSRRLLAAAAGLTVAGLALTGCTSGTTTTPDKTSTSTPDAKSSQSAPQLPGQPKGVTGATDVPTKVKNVAAKRSAVAISTCKATKDGWAATGTAKNSSAKDAAYALTVYFTDDKGTVVGWDQTTVNAASKQTAKWTAAAKFTAPKKTNCVLAGVG